AYAEVFSMSYPFGDLMPPRARYSPPEPVAVRPVAAVPVCTARPEVSRPTAAARPSSVFAAIACFTAGEIGACGERPANARASSVLETCWLAGTAYRVVATACLSARASSVDVGIPYAR